MRKRKKPRLCALLALCAAITPIFAQAPPDLQSLRQLRGQLAATNALRDADVVAVIGERPVRETAARLNGLEIKLANGAVLRVTSVALELHHAAAQVKFGVEARPSAATPVAVNLRVSGRLGGGEVSGSNLRLPFQLTDVSLGGDDSNRASSPSTLRTLFGEWLSPERWNAALPPLEIPLRLSEELEIPASRFDVVGQVPMEVTTPAYRVKAAFTLAALIMLEGRLVVALNLPSTQLAPPRHALDHNSDAEDAAALVGEIERLSRPLTTNGGDLRIRVRSAAINTLLGQIAAAHNTDLDVRLKPARIRAEQVEELFSTLNYTDVEAGDGRADVRSLSAEGVGHSRIALRLSAAGELNVRLRGREYGIPYSLAPRGTFEIRDEIVPLEIVSDGGRVSLRAARGARVPIRVRVGIEIAGQPISIPRTVEAPADEWLKSIALPTLFESEVRMPRRIESGGDGRMRVTEGTPVRYTLSKLRAEAGDDVLEINAEVSTAQ
jgi:hypothetical protein